MELLASSVLLLFVVLELVRRRKLTEEYSFLWILAALALLVVSMRQDMLRLAARWIGVSDPPAVLLAVLIATVFIASVPFGDRVATAAADRAADRGDRD